MESPHLRKDGAFLRPTVAGQERIRELHDRLRSATAKWSEFTQLAPFVGLPSAPALDRAVQQYVRSHERGSQSFSECVLMPTVKCALEFDTLFTLTQARECGREGHPRTFVAMNARSIALSRRHLYCIVSNAFFGAFAARPQKDEDALPTIDYAEIHAATDGENDVEVVKLRLLFDYFAKAGALPRHVSTQRLVSIFRPSASPHSPLLSAARFQRSMHPPVIHGLGESIDDQNSMLRLDFANRWIGGGALSDGCVQEEITFAQCPELNALRWLHGPMADNESIVVRGYCQYATIKKGTYGFSVKYGGPLARAKQLGGALLAVDAIDYRYEGPETQYSRGAVQRELLKLLSALSVAELDDVKDVAGGNWGCGVFRGDVELKFLIQWLACHLAGKVLHYFPFDKPSFALYASVMRQLCRDGLTGERLMSFLTQLRKSGFGGESGGSALAELLIFSHGHNADSCCGSH